MNEEELIELVFRPKRNRKMPPRCPYCRTTKFTTAIDDNGKIAGLTFSCGYSKNSVGHGITFCMRKGNE